eukprot:COSAG02_NODE_4570_length_5209_cov_2.315656_2_plen_155_part_00
MSCCHMCPTLWESTVDLASLVLRSLPDPDVSMLECVLRSACRSLTICDKACVLDLGSESAVVGWLFEEMCPLAWVSLPSCAEPMCEAKGTHHPALVLGELVRSEHQLILICGCHVCFIYEYPGRIPTLFSVFGILTEQVDGDNVRSEGYGTLQL